MSTTGRAIRGLSPVSRQPYNKSNNNRSSNVNRPASAPKDPIEVVDQELERQYDLTPVVTAVTDTRPRASTPSFSIDPWENVASPSDSIDSKNRPPLKQAIVDRTPGNVGEGFDSPDRDHEHFEGDHRDDHGYDPDDEEDEGRQIDRHGMNSGTGDNINGIAKPGNPANRFLIPSDIHPNMEQREEDIAQLRLLAGRLSADWRGQDFMAPALAR